VTAGQDQRPKEAPPTTPRQVHAGGGCNEKNASPLSLMAVILLVTPSGRPRTDAVRPALQATPAAQGCEADPAGDYTQTISGLVEGDTLELRVSARFGGAGRVAEVAWQGIHQHMGPWPPDRLCVGHGRVWRVLEPDRTGVGKRRPGGSLRPPGY